MRRDESYEEMRRNFTWRLPERYNIGVDIVDRHARADPGALALIYESERGDVQKYSFMDIMR